MACCSAIGEDDAALLERYLHDGDEQAITILYLRYQGALHAYARRMLGDEAGAGDLVQDTWEAVLTYRGLAPSGNFRGLLFRVAHNLVLRVFRDRGRWTRAAQEFEREGGVPFAAATCRYCGEPAKEEGMCSTHARRKARGWTEEQMKKPIRRRKKR